jgi:hypothetical protein
MESRLQTKAEKASVTRRVAVGRWAAVVLEKKGDALSPDTLVVEFW